MACPFSQPRHLFQDLAANRDRPGFEFSESLNGYVVSRYEDIVFVLDRPEIFSSRPTVPEFPDPVRGIFAGKVPEKGTLLAWDNPDHDRLRKSVASFFVPRRLERFEPLLRATAHDLIDGFVTHGSVEIKSHFALPLPLRTIVAVAGLDPSRWQWIGQCLSLFGGISRSQGDVRQKVEDVLALHKYVAEVIEARRTDRRDDLISHIWNERDAGNVEMTDFEHLGMIPGLLLAGHETTTNFLSMGLSHLLAEGLWQEATRNDHARSAAIEEILRYESAITGMRRAVTQETKVGTTVFQPGDSLFVAYNSGSRDHTRFEDPDHIDLNRQSKTQHLGFGRGIHACLGAPFARLLLRTELAVLRERLPGLRLKTPYEEIRYLHVHEGRGPVEVEVAWDPPSPSSGKMLDRVRVAEKGSALKLPAQLQDMKMHVVDAKMVTDAVMLITLQRSNCEKVPEWTPGAHIDVAVGNLGYRQYSLCSDPSDRLSMQIAVLKDNSGTGGSKHIHASAAAVREVFIRGPRNNFVFKAGHRKTIFVAGGIGITPLKPMAAVAAANGLEYQLIYLGRTRKSLPFLDELAEAHGERLMTWVTAENHNKRFDLARHLETEDLNGLKVFSCGPEALLAGLESALKTAPPDTLVVERFSNEAVALDAKNEAFEVVLGRSGKALEVPEGKTLLEVINEAGAGVMSTCNKGLCGTCEVRVLEGVPEHRDAVLTPVERAEGASIMACVSRCRGKRLVLDLW